MMDVQTKAVIAEFEEQCRLSGRRAARFAADVARLEEENAKQAEAIKELTERAGW